MPLPLLPIISSAARYVGKNALKKAGLKFLDSGGIKTLNKREDYAVKKYYDKSSPLYKNKKLIKEYYNPKLPIDKKPKNWDADDLFNAMESPLYKYDKQLQNMAKEYIKPRSTRRYGK